MTDGSVRSYFGERRAFRLARRIPVVLALALVMAAALGCASQSAVARRTDGKLLFNGLASRGLEPWRKTGGGAQCANYGTPAMNRHLRGTLSFGPVAGLSAATFALPTSLPPMFPLEDCELVHKSPLRLGADDYYGLMFYIPPGWHSSTRSFWGITIGQFHFQGIWGSPIEFELHNTHLTLALETGACHSRTSPDSGCRWRSNADRPHGHPGNLGAHYILRRGIERGVWHQIIMRVHWATDRTGAIEVWTRIAGAPSWVQTVNLHGHATVQWNENTGCCQPLAAELIGAYRGVSTDPVAVSLSGLLIGTGFQSVAAAMPS